MKKKNVLIIFIIGLFLTVLSLPYAYSAPKALFELFDAGTEIIVDYEKYGEFNNIGKSGYKYKIIMEEAIVVK